MSWMLNVINGGYFVCEICYYVPYVAFIINSSMISGGKKIHKLGGTGKLFTEHSADLTGALQVCVEKDTKELRNRRQTFSLKGQKKTKI